MRFTSAMILSAGLGTRLQPLSGVRAKPAIPVGGEPMVRRIARWLSDGGVTDVVLNLHHRPETIAAALGEGRDLGVRARYSWEQPVLLGAAGGPRQALDIIGAETFFLVNGDTLTDLNLAALSEAHLASGARVTLALVPQQTPARYSGLRLDAEGRVTGVARRAQAEGSYHFVGVQLVAAEVFRSIGPGEAAASIGGVYDRLIATEPDAVRGFVCDAAFWDVGTVADYWSTSWTFIDAAGGESGARGERVSIDPGARVTRSILWDDIHVARGAVLDECLVTDGVRVPVDASHRRMLLWQDTSARIHATPLPV
jgi:mannose-1-phosphate guanylyltransferase